MKEAIARSYIRKIYPNRELTDKETFLILHTNAAWFSVEDWQAWFESDDRKEIQSRIDSIPEVTTEYTIYRCDIFCQQDYRVLQDQTATESEG